MCRVYNKNKEPNYVRLCYKRRRAGQQVSVSLFSELPKGGTCGRMAGDVGRNYPTYEDIKSAQRELGGRFGGKQ